MIWPENLTKRSQDLEACYHDAGQFYWVKTDFFLKEKKILSDNTGALVISELEVQDIDNEIDWKLAELKYKIANANL
jgi:N-acylneuraminate cytidylyltransferase